MILYPDSLTTREKFLAICDLADSDGVLALPTAKPHPKAFESANARLGQPPSAAQRSLAAAVSPKRAENSPSVQSLRIIQNFFADPGI
jgi:hypothetical protein